MMASGGHEQSTQPVQSASDKGNASATTDEVLPALFWDSMPEKPEENADWAAIEALRQECTPEERAETYKMNGNKKLQIGLKAKNKHLLREAVDFYTQGLREKCSDRKLTAVLLSNRAHVESLLGNWRTALNDALDSLEFDSGNAKAVYRAARAAVRLGELGRALQLISRGRQLDPGSSKEWADLEKDAGQQQEAQAAAQAAQAAFQAQRAAAESLADLLIQRGVKMTVPQVRTERSWRPSVEADSQSVVWPLLILYPEGNQQDVVEAAAEQATLAQHLDEMFGPDAPPLEFDPQGQYNRGSIELLYLSHADKPLSRAQLVEALHLGTWPEGAEVAGPNKYGPNASKWVVCQESWSIGELVSRPDHVVPGVPLLFALAKGTDFRQRFMEKAQQ